MTRSHWIATAAALTLTAAAAAAPGDLSPLAQVPATAPIVIHVNGPDALEGHVAAFLNVAVPDKAAAAKAGLEDLFRGGEAGTGRKVVGLARDGHVFFVFFDADIFVPTPAMAILLPVARYADFRQGFVLPGERNTSKIENGVESFTMMGGQPTFLVDRKPYAVVATKKEVAEAFAKGAPGLDGKLTKDQADRFLRSDVSLYLDAEALTKQYADPLKDAHKQINDGLDQAEKAAGDVQKAQWEALRGAADWLFQAADDGRSVLVAGELRADGAVLHAEALLKPDGKTAAALKDVKPSAFRDLGRLPAGQLWYTAWQTTPAVTKLLGPLQFGTAVAPDSDGAKAAQEAVEQLVEAKPASRVQSASVPPAGVEAWEFEDPQKAVAGLTKLLGALRAGDYYLYGTLKDKPEVKPKVVRYRNMDMTYAHAVYDLDKMLADVPDPARRPMLAGLKKLMGDGVSFWFGTDGKTFVQATGKDWASAKRQLDLFFTSDGSAGKDEAFAAVRKELPAEANLAVLIDAVQTAGAVLDYLRPLAETAGGAGPKLPVIKGKPAYVGAALTLRPERVDVDVFVAADAVKQLYKPLEPYLDLFGF